HVNPPDVRVQTAAHRDVDQTVLAPDGDGWFRTSGSEGKQARAGAAAQDDCDGIARHGLHTKRCKSIAGCRTAWPCALRTGKFGASHTDSTDVCRIRRVKGGEETAMYRVCDIMPSGEPADPASGGSQVAIL